ncbi:hypothetical protein BC835DRAFT_1419885 [Cytidiella melzeri]|nr:hypothetical protein BC835DRAFT_1419885 [Cytidiella melzeri]
MYPKLSGPLAKVTIDDILSGATCNPISIADFESFLLYKQHSVECLRFVVWYKSYCDRFFSLPLHLQKLSPPVSQPETAENAVDGNSRQTNDLTSHLLGSSPCNGSASTVLLLAASQKSRINPTSRSGTIDPQRPSFDSILRKTLPSDTPSQPDTLSRQPFRWECASIAHTFLVPPTDSFLEPPSKHNNHASAELLTLNISSSLLNSTLYDLSHSTHPSVFRPVYDHVYDTLRTCSLPYFLAQAATNTNRDKNVYWWIVGLVTFLFGWTVVVVCIYIESRYPGRSVRMRAWRLISVPCFAFSGWCMCSAYRRFCSQVWGRGAVQLRPWELVVPSPSLPSLAGRHIRNTLRRVSADEEGIVEEEPVDVRISGKSPSSLAVRKSPSRSVDVHVEELLSDFTSSFSKVFRRDNPAYSSFGTVTPTYAHKTADSLDFDSVPRSSQNREQSIRPPLPTTLPLESTGMSLNEVSVRLRIFGPERAVVDPRVRAAHKRVLAEILIAGLVWGSIWTAVALALPSL